MGRLRDFIGKHRVATVALRTAFNVVPTRVNVAARVLHKDNGKASQFTVFTRQESVRAALDQFEIFAPLSRNSHGGAALRSASRSRFWLGMKPRLRVCAWLLFLRIWAFYAALKAPLVPPWAAAAVLCGVV